MKRRRLLIALLVSVAAVAILWQFRRHADVTLTFSRADLQRMVSDKFPVHRNLLLADVTFENPVVELQDGRDRIGISLDASVKAGDRALVNGSIGGNWRLRYAPKEGALYFDDAVVTRLDVKGLPDSTRGILAPLAQTAVQDFLEKRPVYRLKEGDLRQDLARTVLRSVSVGHGKLVVVIGAE